MAAAEGLRSHAGVAEPAWGAVLTGVHLAAAAIWAGALLHTVRAALAWRAHPVAVRWAFAEYARTALSLLLAVVATGTATALVLLPAGSLTTTGYGRLLLVKIALVVAAAALATSARIALRRPADHLRGVRRFARAEVTVLAVVFALAAALVSMPVAGTEQQTPPPPAASGPVIMLGTLAGQVGVTVTASDGQLELRLATPRRGDYYGPRDQQEFQLDAQLTPAAGPARSLALRSCGPGCFVSSTTWPSGDNLLSLRVVATGWRGGDIALVVPWPVQPAGELLSSTTAVMRGINNFTVYEAVTSDGGDPLPEPRELPMSVATFLAGEPYGSGIAPIAVRYTRNGSQRLALGFPAEGRTAELVLDARGRITQETLTDAKHLVLRRFSYPDD